MILHQTVKIRQSPVIKAKDIAIHRVLNEKSIDNISSGLDSLIDIKPPQKLIENDGLSFSGSKLDGIGFTLDGDEANSLLSKDSKNREVIFPYLNGIDLNTRPDQTGTRWAINYFDWPEDKAKQYTDIYRIVKERVYPDRQHHSEERARMNWWQYQRIRPELYTTINQFRQVLVVAQTSATLGFCFVPNGLVFASGTIVFAFNKYQNFTVLQSAFHDSWVRRFASTLKTDIRYTPSDVFQTYPFPRKLIDLEQVGKIYHDYRREIMLARQEGLTATYNRFHNPKEKAGDITRLRELHVGMDHAVAAAYGWSDLDLGHGFHETAQGLRYTISEPARREVLSQLLKLNHERYEEEVKAGLHDKKGAKKATTTKTSASKKKAVRAEKPGKAAQLSLLGEVDPAPEQEALFEVPKLSPTPTDAIGDWDQCVCMECGKHLVGFMIKGHTQEKHNGVAPNYRKVGGN